MRPRRMAAGVAFVFACSGAAAVNASELAVGPGAAGVGDYGLAVTVGSTCSAPDVLILDADDSPAAGDYLGCRGITASEVVVTGTNTVFRAGTAITIGEGFAMAPGAGLAMRLEPLQATPFASIQDNSPIAEEVYNVRFHVRTDDLSMATGDEIQHLVAYTADGEVVFRLMLKPGPVSGHVLALVARENGGTYSSTPPGQEVALAAGWNKVELAWSAGAGDGRLEISVNDGPSSGLTSLTNSASVVERVRWGAVAGTLTETSGRLQIDAFNSWR